MKTEEIKELLVARGYSQKNAGLVALEIKTLEPSLIPLWEKWVANANSCENCEAEGYSIKFFMEKQRMTYPAALLTIDWLIKEPNKAKEALKERY
mgnify:CR=1 FL=1